MTGAEVWIVGVILSCAALAFSVLFAFAVAKAIAIRDRRERPRPSLNDVLLRCER